MGVVNNMIGNYVNAGLKAFDTVKKGGTQEQAVQAARDIIDNRLYQSKPGDVTSSSSKNTKTSSGSNTILGTAGKLVSNAITAAKNANDIVVNGGSKEQAIQSASQALSSPINSAKPVQQQPVQQPVQQVPQADPNIANLATQIQSLITAMAEQNKPKVIAPYQSQYDNKIASLINQFNSMPEFKFDATNNPAILAGQENAANAVTQEMGRRNMLNSTVNNNELADRIAKVYATLAPQLEQQAFNQDQSQRQNILQQIQNYMNLDNSDYTRYVNNYNMGQDANQNQFANSMSIASLIDSLDTKNFNKSQTEKETAMRESELTGLYNPYAGVTISPEAQKYSNDYSAEINRRRATPDTADDYLIPQLEAAKANKIFSSPDLMEKYGDIYKTPAQRAAEYSNLIKQQELELKADPNSIENQTKLINLAKAKTELEQLSKYGPQEQELKLQEIKSRINENAASAKASYALASQRNRENTPNANGFTEEQQKYIDFNEELQTIKQFPDTALQTIKENKKVLMDYYGIAKYDALLKEAEEMYKRYGSKSPVYRQF